MTRPPRPHDEAICELASETPRCPHDEAICSSSLAPELRQPELTRLVLGIVGVQLDGLERMAA